jgi:acyl carrier protein
MEGERKIKKTVIEWLSLKEMSVEENDDDNDKYGSDS